MRLFVCIFAFCGYCCGSKILFLPMPQGKSHRGSMYAFAEILAKRGHEVEIFSEVIADKSTPPKGVTETLFPISHVSQEATDFWVHGNSSNMKAMQWGGRMSPALMIMPWIATGEVCRLFLQHHSEVFWELQNRDWDLILIDSLFSHCGTAFASLHYKKHKTPYALMHTSILEGQIRGLRGHNYNPATHAPLFLDNEPMWKVTRFRDRLHSFWNYFSLHAIYSWGILNYFMKRIVAPVIKNVNYVEYVKNAQGHFVEYPQMLETPHAGGLDYFRLGGGCSEVSASPLPKDLEKFVNKKGSKGTILVAFGNYVKWKMAPESVRKPFLTAMALMTDFQIIFQNPTEKYDLPDHVMQIAWLPQKDILAHEKTVLFECLCASMPVVVLPIFGDQFYCGYAMQFLGIGDALDKMALTPTKFSETVRKVIKMNGDRSKMRAVRAQMSDSIMPDLERSAFWAEHIMKHKGFPSEFYKRQGMDLHLIQYLCLDVIFIACATFLGTVALICWCALQCFRLGVFHRTK